VTSHCFAALALWFLGYPDQAVKEAQHGLALAQRLAFPYGVVFAQDFLTWIHLYRGEARAAQAWSEALQPVAIERGFQFLLADNQVLYGMVIAEQGKEAEGCAEIQAGVRAYHATGARMSRPSQLAWLARAHGTAGRVTEGLAVLEEALAIVNDTQERSVEAELWRLKGELTLQQSRSQRRGPRSKKSASFKLQSSQLTNTESRPLIPDPERAAETYFLTALAIARQQQAKSWELRATMSLVRLRQQQVLEHGAMSREHKGRTALAEAHELLSAVYGWFTEGFDTRDLQEAKALLDTRV
jgi:predicted ATPase